MNAQGRIVNQAPTPITPIVLTYYNLGNAKVCGRGCRPDSDPHETHSSARTTLSTVKIDELTVPAGASPEATSLNAPTTKWTVGATARDLGPVTVGLTFRNVNAYYFRSGTNTGVIPTFGTLDANVTLKIPTLENSIISLTASNLFSCTHENLKYSTPITTPPSQPNSVLASSDKGCGFDRKHIEMINMPAIGPMMFLGVRYSR